MSDSEPQPGRLPRSLLEPLPLTLHELRRPLTVMVSYIEMLAEGMLGELSPVVSDAVASVNHAAEAMQRLIDSLTEASRLAGTEVHPDAEVVADELITAAVDGTTPAATLAGVSVRTTAPNGVRLRGDRRELGVALENLCANAITFAPRGSTVVLSTEAAGDQARIVVADQGPGVDQGEAAKIFDPYFRGREARRLDPAGSGLGLTIARIVAERHGGTVTMLPAPAGAAFALSVPRAG